MLTLEDGARKYYLNRSQTPFATLMVDTNYKTTRNDTWLPPSKLNRIDAYGDGYGHY